MPKREPQENYNLKQNKKYMNARLVLRDAPSKFSSNRKREKENLRLGYTSTYITLVWMITFLLVYYVWTININATQGYNIRDLQKKQNELQVELERLDVKIAELESLDTITSDPIFDNMTPIEDPDYVVIRSDVQYVYNN